MKHNKKIEISAIMKIPKGKLEEFKELSTETLRMTHERDTGTLKYDIYINKDGTESEIREEYRDSEALLEHMVNLSDTLKGAFIDFHIDHVNIYGNPSPELLKALKGFDIRIYSFSQGLEEFIEA